MKLIFILICICLLLKNSGSSQRGVVSNPDPDDEIDYVIPGNDD